MASAIIIPIVVVAILGLGGYLVYRYILFDAMRKGEVARLLKRYRIQKTPSQIVREYHLARGESLSKGEVADLEKRYRQTDPGQFLSMYDEIRDNEKPKE